MKPLERFWWQWWCWGVKGSLGRRVIGGLSDAHPIIDTVICTVLETWCGLTTGHRFGVQLYLTADHDPALAKFEGLWYVNCANCLKPIYAEGRKPDTYTPDYYTRKAS